ncbi:phage head closure protein [Peptostreptococcus equinus]|uniref:Phage head closure protein n=1 Tax=Peptostreptococcus equinus TaxID=3003601 RepID=A0ABY7JNT0_9FIRM|nr:phage head closure protein [Peptostreptococcus sp. CBA3647]WAW14750.1 phage head closure protein [Peptostreptococcus sp. CBA3647]
MKIDIGNMDTKVYIHKKDVVGGKVDFNTELKLNELGEVIQTDSEYKSLWAEVKEMRGAEKLDAGITQSTKVIKIVIRYRNDITENNIIKYNDIEYEIESIVELGRKQYLEIMARYTKNG